MDLRKFYIGRIVGVAILLFVVGIVGGFYALNNYIYKEKQGGTMLVPFSGTPTFVWKYESADTLNLDGIPNTNIYLEVVYEDVVVEKRLIDTTPGSCNDLPDTESDTLENSTNIQCYSAGLGYRFKITKGMDGYLVERKTFEEALPDYAPPVYEYEVISEFPFSIYN